MCVYRVIDGEEVFNFQYIDELFDTLLGMGIRPVVELNFMPSDMTDETHTLFWWRANHKDINAVNTFCDPKILNIEYIEDMSEITLEPLSAYVLEISID